MKYKREIIITIIISILVIFFKLINVFQIENNLGKPLSLIILILVFSFLSILIQRNIDKNYSKGNINHDNLDILKYICAILIIILHLRPFLSLFDSLDLAFNNIITRICVPLFFLISGYFISIKEKNNTNYIKKYIKKTISLYLVWSIIYIPIIILEIINNFELINQYIPQNISLPILIILFILLLPIAIIIALLYSGIYYHLWYFPALLLSLIVLNKWKKRFNIKILLVISFFLLLFGATETYYGVLPVSIQNIISHYYDIFFTTRNFLFFGLFYVVFGYYIGNKKKVYSKYCFEKLIISFIFLIFEGIFLHDTARLNSNILLSCIPLSYYLFISVIYFNKPNKKKINFNFRELSKYYYLVHPAIICLYNIILRIFNLQQGVYMQIFIIIMSTHILSLFIIYFKKLYKQRLVI